MYCMNEVIPSWGRAFVLALIVIKVLTYRGLCRQSIHHFLPFVAERLHASYNQIYRLRSIVSRGALQLYTSVNVKISNSIIGQHKMTILWYHNIKDITFISCDYQCTYL